MPTGCRTVTAGSSSTTADATGAEGNHRTRLIVRRVKKSASQIGMAHLMTLAQVVWCIKDDDTVSDTCIHAEELLAGGARSCHSLLDVMTRMDSTDGVEDSDLAAALRKYVEDTCEAIKQADNVLNKRGTGLAMLLAEVPDRLQVVMSWRDLIGRLDVIAHRLLTVDDQRIRREAVRDFGLLHEMLSRVYFVPTKTNLKISKGFNPMFKAGTVRRFSPAKPDSQPTIGRSLVFICEDEKSGFAAFQFSCTASNRVRFTGRHGVYQTSIACFTCG